MPNGTQSVIRTKFYFVETHLATGLVTRALTILELLSESEDGLGVLEVADALGIPKSGAHRLLGELAENGFVRQDATRGRYVLTARLFSLGCRQMAHLGVTDFAQPVLDRLAAATESLVRLAVLDGDNLVYALKAQGARSGLRYDPDMGQVCPLFCTATGHALLSCFSDEEALDRVVRQGLNMLTGFGPKAPRSLETLLAHIRLAREDGYAVVVDASIMGASAAAAAVRHPVHGDPVGVVSIAGPSVQFDEARLRSYADDLQAAARELETAAPVSQSLSRAAAETI